MGNPDLPKVLTPALGKPLVSYQLETLRELPELLAPCVVVGFGADLVKSTLGGAYTYVLQEELLGTGHAVAQARAALEGNCDVVLVLYGDQPLITKESIAKIVDVFEKTDASLVLATFISDNPTFTAFGRILRDEEGNVVGIREHRDCTPQEAAIQEYNPALYCFRSTWLWSALEKITPQNAQAEYYLTDLVQIALQEGVGLVDVVIDDWQEFLGVNTPDQLADVEQVLAARAS